MNKHELKYENVRLKLIGFAYDYLKTNEKEDLDISEVCSSTKISRTTFYNHYQNTQDLFDDLLIFIKEKFVNNLKVMSNNELSKDDLINFILKRNISFYKQNFDFFIVVFKLIPFDSYAYWDFFYEQLLDLGMFSNMKEGNQRYYMRFFVGGFFSLLYKWCQDGFKETEDDIYNLILEMVRPFHNLG